MKKLNRKKTKLDIDLITSGSTLLNLGLTNQVDGGYKCGRIVNIVGDKSSGKTLLAIEAITDFLRKLSKEYPDLKLRARYVEAEAAFDKPLAASYGMPIDKVEFPNDVDDDEDIPIHTIESWYEDLVEQIEKDDYDFMLYVVDSLDALSSEAELDTDIRKGSFGGSKPKKIGELFRRLVVKIQKKNILIIVISQIRDKIGVVFGETKTRSGGKALDFYASQILWLAETRKLKKNDRVYGIDVRGKVKKNKVWKPFREVDFSIIFGHGIDDVGSMVDFLKKNKVFASNRIEWEGKKYTREAFITYIEENNLESKLQQLTKQTWDKLEDDSKVVRKPKYED